MKNLLLAMLVLPWAVLVSSTDHIVYNPDCPKEKRKFGGCETTIVKYLAHTDKSIVEFNDREDAQDFVDAMNAAHERRTKPNFDLSPACNEEKPDWCKGGWNGCFCKTPDTSPETNFHLLPNH